MNLIISNQFNFRIKCLFYFYVEEEFAAEVLPKQEKVFNIEDLKEVLCIEICDFATGGEIIKKVINAKKIKEIITETEAEENEDCKICINEAILNSSKKGGSEDE